jgi:hypothetical protein
MNDLEIAEYDDGTAGLTALGDLTVPVLSPPQAPFKPFAEYADLGDGAKMGTGRASTEWIFPIIQVDEAAQLAEYCPNGCAQVYISTPDHLGDYHVYLASMVWPIEPPIIKAGQMENLVIHYDIIQQEEDIS